MNDTTLPETKPVDILEIDAVSFATRVAQVAAAEICGLLTTGEPTALPDWYKTEESERDQEKISADIEAMAAYIVQRQAGGEQLWRWNVAQKRAPRDPDWTAADLADRVAYDLFSSTLLRVNGALEAAHAEAQFAADQAAQTPAPGLKREDSIFEETEGLGDMSKEAVEASRLTAERKKAEQQERRIKRRLEAARKREEKARADQAAAEQDLAQAQQQKAALSVGEPPATPPVNRGGRGRKKQKGNNS